MKIMENWFYDFTIQNFENRKTNKMKVSILKKNKKKKFSQTNSVLNIEHLKNTSEVGK